MVVSVGVLASSNESPIAVGGGFGTPTQLPAVHASSCVQPFPSSHTFPESGISVHAFVPLHVRVLHWSLVQVIEVPPQAPAVQTSSYVQALPSSQEFPVSG